MKRKRILSRIGTMFIAMLVTITVISEGISVFAYSPTTKATQKTLSEWSYNFNGSGLPNGFNITNGKYDDDQYRYAWANQVPYFLTSSGEYAYCIHLGNIHHNGAISDVLSLEKYLQKSYIHDNMQTQIKELCIYSFKGKTQYGYTSDIEICASVAMAQAISSGFFDDTILGLSSNETKLLNCYNFNGVNASSQHNKLIACYKKMKEEMLSHYDIPKGMSVTDFGKPLDNATYQLKYNKSNCRWETTISMDSTLSQFKLPSVSGVTFTRSGSKLKVSATETGRRNLDSSGAISISKVKGKYVKTITECSPLILSGSNAQEMISSDYNNIDPIQAYFKLESATGNLKINKQLLTASGQKVNGTAEQYNDILFQLSFLDSDNVRHYLISTKDSDGVYTYANTTTDISSSSSLYRVGADGTLQIKGLPAGTFNLSEYKTADGFKLAGDVHVTVNADKTTSVTIKNSGTGSHIDVYKSANDWNGSEIEDTALLEKIYSATKFRAYVMDSGVKKYITAEPDTQTGTEHSSERYFITNYTGLTNNADNAAVLSLYSNYDGYYNTSYSFFGTARLKNVPEEIERVYFEEIQSYNGFGFYNGNIKVSQNKNDVSFTNRAYYFRAGFNKYEEGTTDFLSDGIFGLYASENVYFNGTLIYSAGQEIERIASDGETTYFSTMLLACGTYYIQEIEAPTCFIKDDTKYEVKANMPTTLTNSRLSDVVLNIENEEIRFAVSKQNVYGDEVPGAQMQLIDETGGIVEEWTSDGTDHIVSGLAAGNYTLHEYYAPSGYCIATDIAVTIDEYGKIFADNTEVTAISDDGLALIVMIDEATKVQISKQDITGEGELPGATLQVLDGDTVIDEWVSGTEPHYIEGKLTAGKTYTLRETIAPDGYVLKSDIEFTVNTDGSVNHVVMYNSDSTGTVQVQKRTEGMVSLSGITLHLRGTSDSGKAIDIPAVTDETGLAVWTAIPTGTYEVYEDADTVPTAYLVADPIEVTVMYAQTTTAEIFNNEKTGSIVVNKTTEGMLNIEGREFVLSGTSDGGREISISAKTDKNGKATFDNIPVETYTVTETTESTPYAYLTADPVEVTVFYAEETNIEVKNEEKTGSIQVSKRTEGMTDISGIEFILSGTSDSGRDIRLTSVTNTNGNATFTAVPVGTYTITENGDTVPVGYMVADDQTVQVFYAETTNVIVNNEKIPEIPDSPPPTGAAAVSIPAILILGGFILSARRNGND